VSNEHQAELWPLAFEELEKGSIVSAETLEHIVTVELGHKVVRGTDEYNLGVLGVVTMIRAHRPDLRVRRAGHNLRVLADDEYAGDNDRRMRAAIKNVLRTANLPVPDAEALTQVQRDEWDRAQNRATRHARALLEKEREIRAIRAALEANRLPATAKAKL
jgi:hypothetical protein